MKTLFIAPPQENTYFNACYNFTELGEVATHTAKLPFLDSIDVTDSSVLVGKEFDRINDALSSKKYDCVILWNRFGNISNLSETIKNINDLQGDVPLITYGQPSSLIPEHFMRNYSVDAIAHSGPWELGIASYMGYLAGKQDAPSGVFLRNNSGFNNTKNINFPEKPFWSFPDLDLLPLEEYFDIYSSSKNIAGIQHKRDLGFSLSRGCRTQCKFCTVHKMHGNKEVRKPVADVTQYLDENYEKYNFDFVSFFSPIFTSDKQYTIDLCNELKSRSIDWKCVTHINLVDEELISVMADSGCQRIGFGVETMNRDAQKYISKHTTSERLNKTIDLCNDVSVRPLVFLMLGIPGETKDSFVSTVQKMHSLGAGIRVTAYTPYYQLLNSMSPEEVVKFDRVTSNSHNVEGMSSNEFKRATSNFDSWLEEIL